MKLPISKMAHLAGISVRTLHYYDEIGLLKPASVTPAGYRLYSEEEAMTLQQIMFFREIGFSLASIKEIINQPGFDGLKALRDHRAVLLEKIRRTSQLIDTIDKTIKKWEGEIEMEISEYYQGFNDKDIKRYRSEARRRWGDQVVEESEKRVMNMGKSKFEALQEKGNGIFQSIADNMSKGAESEPVQKLVSEWREWLNAFHDYSDEAALNLGHIYSEDAEFAAFFNKFHPDLPDFLTRAIVYYFKTGE
ncbi:MAG: MerR family transcriptional regulator [Dehalococcoidales bacterium]|jgi:DNA-binding transcriptional MerR regulator|nr:MerR family transcriptional regulator [Dehalococcoidales bacterium]MDX9986642.1 MerR family transcriptional regulator [Dehalococcoidales bacterium]NLE90869.1 MerR family transcriptional regulator [Dehalococcoidales bacterium]